MYMNRLRQSLHVDAPNLRCLKLEGVTLDDFSVTSAHLLQRFTFCTRFLRNKCSLLEVFQGLDSTAKKLKLSHDFLMLLGRVDRTDVSFNHLKIVALHVDLEDLKVLQQAVLRMLRSMPNLEELKIKYWDDSEDDMLKARHDFWNSHALVELFDKRERVKMTGIVAKRCDFDFIKFLLAKAQILRRLVIGFDKSIRKKFVMKEVLKFPRISSQAEILLAEYGYSAEAGEDGDDEEAESLTRGISEGGDLGLVKIDRKERNVEFSLEDDEVEEDKRE